MFVNLKYEFNRYEYFLCSYILSLCISIFVSDPNRPVLSVVLSFE